MNLHKLFSRKVLKNYQFRVGRKNEDLLLLTTILLEEKYNIYEINYIGYNYLQREGSITKQKFGSTITDTLYNCCELREIAGVKRPELKRYFNELLLYQARTFIILMPKSYIKEQQIDYLFAMGIIRKYKKEIKAAFFSKKDKIFLKICLTNVSLAKLLLNWSGVK